MCWAGCQQAGNQFVETVNVLGWVPASWQPVCWNYGLKYVWKLGPPKKQRLNKVLGWVPASWQPVCWSNLWTKCWAGCQQAGNQFVETIFEQSVGLFVETIFEQSVGLGASKLATSLLKQSLNKVLGWVPASWQPVCWNNLWTKCWAGCQQAGNQFVETIFEQISVGLVASKLATSLLKQSLNK